MKLLEISSTLAPRRAHSWKQSHALRKLKLANAESCGGELSPAEAPANSQVAPAFEAFQWGLQKLGSKGKLSLLSTVLIPDPYTF